MHISQKEFDGAQKQAASACDSSWKYSWHWEREKNGSQCCTKEGFRQAVKDLEEQRRYFLDRAEACKIAAAKIEALFIAQGEPL